jgi:hypothetical protein
MSSQCPFYVSPFNLARDAKSFIVFELFYTLPTPGFEKSPCTTQAPREGTLSSLS